MVKLQTRQRRSASPRLARSISASGTLVAKSKSIFYIAKEKAYEIWR